MEFEHHRAEHVDDGMLLIQVNLDDMNPEHCSYVTDKLLECGANDVYWVPIIMKKGRPGLMLNVLTALSELSAVEEIVFKETTTLGLRYLQVSCHRLGREFYKVSTSWGEVMVKAGFYKGELVHYAPEFRDCENVAKANAIPLKQVYDEVKRRFMEEVGTVEGKD